jgi:hypothetical protein
VAKYDPLGWYLEQQHDPEVVMTFDEIDSLLGCPLPFSAQECPAWWANENKRKAMRIHAHAWLDSGFEVSEDLVRRMAIFSKVAS